jgi:hypothetical protein
MPVAAVVLLTLAVVLAVFGGVFAYLGMSSERAYWSQRDPSGDPNREATPFRTVVVRAFPIAASDQRAPLRIAAIGVVMWWIAAASAAVALLLILVG